MESKYDYNSKIFKALSDSNRLQIIDILSCGEKCACKLLEHFNFTQPTLSHHMKVLIDCGLVRARKEGTWNYYSLNTDNSERLVIFLSEIVSNNDNCICNQQPTHLKA